MRLGVLEVERVLSLTAKQFRGWEHMNELEALIDVEEREDYRIASIVQMLHNIHRAKNTKPLPLKEFILKFGEMAFEAAQKPPQTQEQQFAILKVLSAMHAGDVPSAPKVWEQKLPDNITIAEQSALDRAREVMQRAMEGKAVN